MTKAKLLKIGIPFVLVVIVIIKMFLFEKETSKVEGADFENLFVKEFEGITTTTKQLKDADYVSSAYISVKEGETIWFGPCDISQSIQVATFDKEGQPISNPQGQKPLEAVDVFGNNLVIITSSRSLLNSL